MEDTYITIAVILSGFIGALSGFALYPIARKLGNFLEHVGQERAERAIAKRQLAGSLPPSVGALPETIDRLETEVRSLTERQARVERLLENELGRRNSGGGELPVLSNDK